MSLVIDDEIDRLAEHLAAVLRVDKIEAMRVALANELRLYEASPAREAEPQPPGRGGAAGSDNGPEADTGSALR